MRWIWLACVLAACGGDEAPATCEVSDGRIFKLGDNFPYGDGCNGCHCFADSGRSGCTAIGCQRGEPREACEPVLGTECSLGPACGAGCCGQGERCVNDTCMCGASAACGGGDICGSFEAIGSDGCGVMCCPPEGCP